MASGWRWGMPLSIGCSCGTRFPRRCPSEDRFRPTACGARTASLPARRITAHRTPQLLESVPPRSSWTELPAPSFTSPTRRTTACWSSTMCREDRRWHRILCGGSACLQHDYAGLQRDRSVWPARCDPRYQLPVGNDTYCHRVLGYPIPIASNAPGSNGGDWSGRELQLGTPNFGGLAAPGLYYPNQHLCIQEPPPAVHRRWSQPPRAALFPGHFADRSRSCARPAELLKWASQSRRRVPGLDTFANPAGVDTDGVHLAVADFSNNRVLLWNTIPTSNGQPADVVLGQPDPVSNTVNTLPTKGPLQFRQPRNATSDGPRLFVSDGANHRVLIWNSFPRNGRTAPDVVLGQTDMQGRQAQWRGSALCFGMNSP
jgi:hypothetical protein